MVELAILHVAAGRKLRLSPSGGHDRLPIARWDAAAKVEEEVSLVTTGPYPLARHLATVVALVREDEI